MRLISLIVALMFILSACSIGGDDDETPTSVPESTPTAEQAQATETEPAATPADEPSPTTDATAEPTTEPTEEPEPTEQANTTPTAEAGDDQDIAAIIDDIAGQTAEVRGLEMMDELNSQIINREQLQENLTEVLEEDYGQEGADLDRDLLWMLRLIEDRNLDYYQLQLDLLTEQVAGYYDSEADELYVISDSEGLTPNDKVTTAHEITHALQDQHYGLDRYDEDDTDFDAISAFAAVYEGDATWAMVQWAGQHLTQDELMEFIQGSEQESPTFDAAPSYVQASLLFPYEAGFSFVEALMTAGEYDAVNDALENPPVSTEQIMHPEKFISDPQDVPLEVDIPDLQGALGEGWEETYQGTLGEFDIEIMLDENGAADAETAAEGWGGTRFIMYGNDTNLLTVLATRWDTEEDAAEYEEALTETLSEYDQEGETWTDGDRYYAITTSGDRVVLTTSTNPDALTTASDAQAVNSP